MTRADHQDQIAIGELDLSVRVFTNLKANGITTVGQLLTKKEDELLSLRHFGRKSLKEIKEKLVEKGFVEPDAMDAAGSVPDEANAAGPELLLDLPARVLGPVERHRADAGVLVLLARVLPASERLRFGAEQRGNLGGLRGWERICHLAGFGGRHAATGLDDVAREPPRPSLMGCAWLLKRLLSLAVLAAVPTSVVVALTRNWTQIATFVNGTWPQWVGNVANVVQIGSPAIALLAVWLTKVVRSRGTEPGAGVAVRLLGLLALLLPARDRERFVDEVLANMADLRWRQRVVELLSVARVAPGLAVILRWARRRRA